MRTDSLYGDGSAVRKKTSVPAQQNLRAKTVANALVSSALQRQTKNQIASDLSPQTQKQEQVRLKKAQTQASAGTSGTQRSTLTPETAYNLFVPPALSTAPAVRTASSSPSDRMPFVVGLLTNPLPQSDSTAGAEPAATVKDWSDMTGKERIDALVAAQAAQAGIKPSGLFTAQKNADENSGSGLDSGTDSAYAEDGTENESPQVVTPLDKLSEAADNVSPQAPYGQSFKNEAADLADAFADTDAAYRDYAAKDGITASDEKALNQLQKNIAAAYLTDADPNSLSYWVAKDYFDLFGDLAKKGPIAKAAEAAVYPVEKLFSGTADGSVGVIGSGAEFVGNLLSGGQMDQDFETLDAYFAANPDALQDLLAHPDRVAQKTGVNKSTLELYTVANAGTGLDAYTDKDASSLPAWYKDTVGSASYSLGQQLPLAALFYLCGLPAESGSEDLLDSVIGDKVESVAGDTENINPKDLKPPEWNEDWEWRYPEANKPYAKPRWFDPDGGEWRWHAPDKYHLYGHWDYNPWDEWNSEWQNIYPD